ncbi:hypothetical protein PAXINDRAFT_102811, partial [Paxillus involutus ATCC 200175]
MEHAACQATDSESKSGLASSIPFGLFEGRTPALPQASAFKRSNSKVGDGEYATEGQQNASKKVDYNHVPLDRVAFITEAVVGCKSFRISFTANCMRGRSTTVFCVKFVVGNEPRHLGEQNGALQRLRKNNDPHQNIGPGLEWVHRYTSGINRTQPWVHFAVAPTVARNRVALLRGDISGTEHLELALSDGRGCIEFIRILLGIALAEEDDLGQSSDVDLGTKECHFKVFIAKATSPPKIRVQASYRESKATASSSQPHSASTSLSTHDTSQAVISSLGLASPGHTRDASVPSGAAASSVSKRSYSEVDHGDDTARGGGEEKPSKKAKTTHLPRVAFIHVAVHGHKCLGILFTASSIRGRGTTVFYVGDLQDDSKLLALKMTWQNLEREAERHEILERLEESKSEKIKLKESNPHATLVVPFKNFKASRKNETYTTLGVIRAFLANQLAGFPIEHGVLSVSLSGLKRPVKYFWGVHDFVRGVRGAVLGHQYLTSIGVLHRDISENNIVLARRPGEERGYLIDFDMAILQEPEQPTEAAATVRTKREGLLDDDDDDDDDDVPRSSSPIPSDELNSFKALRTGTIPYMSFNVLYGGRHAYFDDMESFLYVVFLFFFTYAGPLSKEELRIADTRGFTQPVGSGRLTHIRGWPPKYAGWADGNMQVVAEGKDSGLGKTDSGTKLVDSAE